MTFIASVIAKEGIALVADSFVTSVEHSLDEDSFIEYLNTAKDKENIPTVELIKLFKRKPSHTRNYVDKLYEFDKFSAVSITGAAYINGKEIKDIVKSISAEMQIDEAAYRAKDIVEILDEFCSKIKDEVLQHLTKNSLTPTEFIFSHYNINKNLPQVFLIKVRGLDKDNFDPDDSELIGYTNQSNLGIVTDGQDTFVDRLIFGSLYNNVGSIKEELINCVTDTIKLTSKQKKELQEKVRDFSFLQKTVTDDMFSINFRELSLQEALNLAALLIKIVMDIQVYTEKIPTVGGLIRLAVIHKETGFAWISGNTLEPSKII